MSRLVVAVTSDRYRSRIWIMSSSGIHRLFTNSFGILGRCFGSGFCLGLVGCGFCLELEGALERTAAGAGLIDNGFGEPLFVRESASRVSS